MITSEIIKGRISCRSYKDDPLTESDKNKVKDYLSEYVQTPFGNTVRFKLVDLGEREAKEVKTLATYGFIKGASTFIVGAVIKGNLALEDYGCCMEKNILAATYWGLGTCWLGGTFDRISSASRINKRDDEVVPAITPVGYPRDKKSITDSTIRFFVKSSSRKAWEELFFDGDTRRPLTRNIAGKYELPLECVRLGPSASNKQPWRVIKEKDQDVFHFYISRTPRYAEKYPEVSLQDVDMGIAMCHFQVALEEMKLKGSWQNVQGPPQKGLEYLVSWVREVDQ